MAEQDLLSSAADDAEKIKQEKKQFKEEQKAQKKALAQQKKEAKKKAKEIAAREADLDDDGSSTGPVVFTTLIIVLVWIGIICALIKLDVGGFGSNVLTPIFKDVPVVNMILPSESTVETNKKEEAYGGYSSLKDAVEQIKKLELQIDQLQSSNTTYVEQIEALKAEVKRLKTFEDNQVAFQEIKEEFYQEVVYAENGPGPDEYQKYYEEMDPATAEQLYKQVIQSEATDKKMKDYATTFSKMQASEAAKILGSMTDNLELAAQILESLGVEDRGAIMGAMDPAVAARITKIMDPNS